MCLLVWAHRRNVRVCLAILLPHIDTAVTRNCYLFCVCDKNTLYITNNERSSCLGGWNSVPAPFGSLTGHILQADCLILQAGSTLKIHFSILLGVYRNHSCSGENKSCRCSIKPSLDRQHSMVGGALEEDSSTATRLAA